MAAQKGKRPPFAKLDVDLASNEKILDLPPDARWLYVVGILAASRDLTDGHIRPTMVLAEADVAEGTDKALLDAGLWHDAGHRCKRCPQPKARHVLIHDYLDHQQSRAQVEERSAQKADAGHRGAQARWGGERDGK